MPIVVYHDAWVYLNHWLGLDQLAELEPKPGIPPTSSHLSAILKRMQRRACTGHYPRTLQDRLVPLTGCMNIRLYPFSAALYRRRYPAGKDLFGLFDSTLALLLGISAMNFDGLDPVIIAPALAAGMLVTATHVPLGQQVLKRGIIFIDLAIAQIAALGVLLAHSLGLEGSATGVQLTAFGSALLGAFMLYQCERRWSDHLEAIIGSVFVLAASPASCCWLTIPMVVNILRICWSGRYSGLTWIS